MNNKLIQSIGYLLYIIVFGYMVIKADDYRRYLKDLYSSSYDGTSLWLFSSIFPILVGILMALPHLIRQDKHHGSWKLDWILLLTVGIPALAVAITPITYLAELPRHWSLIGFIVGYHPSLVTVAGILFGFTFVFAWSKQDSEY